MIEFYYWPTPNDRKITMFLEEAGLDCTIYPIDISAGDQFKPEFLAFSPNNRMAAIIDPRPADGGEALTVFESGTIPDLPCREDGSVPAEGPARAQDGHERLFWQRPMAGQNHHFTQYAPEKIPYAIDRYVKEMNWLYVVLDLRLRKRLHRWRRLHPLNWRSIVDCAPATPAPESRCLSQPAAAVFRRCERDRRRDALTNRANRARIARPLPKKTRESC